MINVIISYAITLQHIFNCVMTTDFDLISQQTNTALCTHITYLQHSAQYNELIFDQYGIFIKTQWKNSP